MISVNVYNFIANINPCKIMCVLHVLSIESQQLVQLPDKA